MHPILHLSKKSSWPPLWLRFLFLHTSNVHQHTLNRSREATLLQDTDFLSEVGLLQNLRACKTWILNKFRSFGWRMYLITWRLEFFNAFKKSFDFMSVNAIWNATAMAFLHATCCKGAVHKWRHTLTGGGVTIFVTRGGGSQ